MSQKILSFKSEKNLLPIGDIPELHACLQNSRRKAQLHPLAQPNDTDIDLASFLALLTTFPIQVHQYRNQYRCVGNIRMWELCRAWFDSDQPVPVEVVQGRINREYWARNQLLELVYLNVVYGLMAEDCATLYDILAKWPEDLEMPPLFPSKAAYRRAMRVGKGRMSRG